MIEEKHRLYVKIPQRYAIKYGVDTWGEKSLDVKVSELSPEQRNTFSEILHNHIDLENIKVSPSASVSMILDAYRKILNEKRFKQATEFKTRWTEYRQKYLDNPETLLVNVSGKGNCSISRPEAGRSWDRNTNPFIDFEWETINKEMETTLQAMADEINAEKQRKEEIERKNRIAQNEKNEQGIMVFLEKHNHDAYECYKQGVLADSEISRILKKHVFEGVAENALIYDDAESEYEQYKTESLSIEEWKRYKSMDIAPEVFEVTFYRNENSDDEDDYFITVYVETTFLGKNIGQEYRLP